MLNFFNKFITFILVPIYFCVLSPTYPIIVLFNQPQELISLSENGVGSAEDPVYLTAHRGTQALAPENSIPCFQESINHGYYSAECDIHLSKDNKWVVLHNQEVDGRFCQYGKVRYYTLEELKTFSYRWGANLWKYKDMRIPTLEEYLDLFIDADTRPQIEIKTENCDMIDSVVAAITERGLTDKAIVISFDLQQLKAVYDLDPNIELWYLVGEMTPEIIAETKAVSDKIWLSAAFDQNDEEDIILAMSENVNFSLWTVNTIEDAKRLYDMGVRYMETDILCN